MKLSTKGRYGARAMLELALHYDKDIVQLKDVAKEQEISARYLEHLFIPLKLAGLIRSIRGAQGGYVLAKLPSQIRLSEILRVLEGSMAPVECVDDPKFCHRASICVTRHVWSELKNAIVNILEFTTLQNLVERQREKENPGKLVY